MAGRNSFDVTLTPVQNANRYYKLYNKAKTAKENTIKMLKEVDGRVPHQSATISIWRELDEIREIRRACRLNIRRKNQGSSDKAAEKQN